jgi:predicted nucleotidyltransferase
MEGSKVMMNVEFNPLLDAIIQKLRSDFIPQKVILYGSYAYGNSEPGSDLDLLIIKETSERFIDRWQSVRRILSDPNRMAFTANTRFGAIAQCGIGIRSLIRKISRNLAVDYGFLFR